MEEGTTHAKITVKAVYAWWFDETYMNTCTSILLTALEVWVCILIMSTWTSTCAICLCTVTSSHKSLSRAFLGKEIKGGWWWKEDTSCNPSVMFIVADLICKRTYPWGANSIQHKAAHMHRNTGRAEKIRQWMRNFNHWEQTYFHEYALNYRLPSSSFISC